MRYEDERWQIYQANRQVDSANGIFVKAKNAKVLPKGKIQNVAPFLKERGTGKSQTLFAVCKKDYVIFELARQQGIVVAGYKSFILGIRRIS